jgi:hypothetical protein
MCLSILAAIIVFNGGTDRSAVSRGYDHRGDVGDDRYRDKEASGLWSFFRSQ